MHDIYIPVLSLMETDANVSVTRTAGSLVSSSTPNVSSDSTSVSSRIVKAKHTVSGAIWNSTTLVAGT